MSAPTCVRPTPEDLLPLFRACFSRAVVKELLRTHAPATTYYWRLYTPLVLLWCGILQRLQADHTTDAVVSHLHTGAADALDPADPHPQPLSQRLRSESTSAYVQGRARLPLALLHAALRRLATQVHVWLTATSTPPTWHGHAVRLLDGTTFRLAPSPSLVAAYGQAGNQHGTGYWVVVRSVATFCLYTQLCTAVVEDPPSTSESALVRPVMDREAPGTLYVGDINFGVFRVAQVATALQQHVVVRVRADRARALLRQNGQTGPWRRGQSWAVQWTWKADTQVEPTLPATPIPGRVLYVQLSKPGFRPMELYLFTTLTDAQRYPLDAVVELYGRRWQVEVDYRHLKTTLEMEEFAAQSPEVFRHALAAGLLTYNLIRAVMVQAAVRGEVAVTRLSFQRCWRRLRDALLVGVPAWVLAGGQVATYLLDRLARCRLPQQPTKVAHEPRKVRRRPQVFPALKGDRDVARAEVLRQLGWVGDAEPGEAPAPPLPLQNAA